MKKRFKNIQIFLVMAISFFIFALPAYLRYANFSEANFVSSDLSFEKPDQENGPSDYGNELIVFGPTAFSIIFLPGTNLLRQSFHFFSQALSPCQKPFILRC
jgi:hypothetical protein